MSKMQSRDGKKCYPQWKSGQYWGNQSSLDKFSANVGADFEDGNYTEPLLFLCLKFPTVMF